MKLLPPHQWVVAAMKASSITQAELARRLTTGLHRNIDKAAVNKMRSGKRAVAADEMLAIEEITGFPIPSPSIPFKVPLVEWVNAGKLAEPKSQIPAHDLPLLTFPDLGSGDFFALKVRGDSMDRISPEGSVIVINRADRTLVSGKPYVFSVKGETTFKMWQGDDPPYLAPYSTNPMHQPQFVNKRRGLEIIGRVKRTTLDL